MALVSRFMKVLAVVSLLGFFGAVADIHLDEASPQQNDSCCVTCCPAHNLGPSLSLLHPAPVDKIDRELPVKITVYSEEFIASVFHPPRPAA